MRAVGCPGPIHLTRNVCDGCAVWCQFDASDWERTARSTCDTDHYAEGYTHKPSEASCVECLKRAETYGDDCLVRLAEMTDPSTAVPWT